MAVECIYIFPAWGSGNNLANYVYKTSLDLPLRHYEESQLAITNIEGLAPVSSNVNITQYAARDGGIFNSSRQSERHITITMKLFKDPSMDAVRNKVYSYCQSGEPIGLIFEFSDGYAKAINGYVEDTPADYFGEQEGIQIAVSCPDPKFRQVFINHDTHEFNTDFKKGQFKLPSKEIVVEPSNEFNIEFSETIKDSEKISDINSLFAIKNSLGSDKDFLYALGIGENAKGLKVNFYSSKPTIEGEVDEFINVGLNESYIENLFYHLQDKDKKYDSSNGYQLITSEIEFNYRTKDIVKLTSAPDSFIQNLYYERTDSPEPGIWIPVTWEAYYSDEQDPTKYDYPVKYGFLNNNLVDGKIVNSIVSIFDTQASYFSSAERMFFDLSKSGTPLSSPQQFNVNTFYKLVRTYELIEGVGGWTHVLDDDPIYFFDNIEAYEYANGEFNPYLPLYGFYNITKQYAVMGTVYVSGKFYYINASNEEVLVTGSTPSDWESSMVNKKYYEKISTFYGLTNYPGTEQSSDNTILGGRCKYDVILDYLTYKYTAIEQQMAYEPNVYYEFIGYAETELEGIYGLSVIPIYQLLTGEMPSDWGSSTKYFTRTRMTALERPYELFFNDHAYYEIKNRAVFRYELLDSAPSDWDTNYSNYYTLQTDYSNIIAFFTPGEYPDYSKLYSLLGSEPADFITDFSKYYRVYDTIEYVYKKTGSELGEILVNDSDNIKATIDLEPGSFTLGDESGSNQTIVFRSPGDIYFPNTYYTYNTETNEYSLITDSVAPEDWATEPYKYYKKVSVNAYFIEPLTIIFWNPASKQLEYDMDQYELFLNDFETWSKNALAAVTRTENTSTGNRVYYRNKLDNGKYFKTYAISRNYISNKENLKATEGDTFILANTVRNDGTINYNPIVLVGISSYN